MSYDLQQNEPTTCNERKVEHKSFGGVKKKTNDKNLNERKKERWKKWVKSEEQRRGDGHQQYVEMLNLEMDLELRFKENFKSSPSWTWM